MVRVVRVVDQVITGVHTEAANDERVVLLPVFFELHSPTRTSPRVARCEVGDERRSTERDFVSVVQDAVDRNLTGAPVHTPPTLDVLLHDHDLGSDAFPEKYISGLVVPVGVAAQDDLDVGEVEAELRHAAFDHRNRSLEVRVDEDVPFGRRDQKRAQPSGTHEVEVVHDLMGRERVIPTVL